VSDLEASPNTTGDEFCGTLCGGSVTGPPSVRETTKRTSEEVLPGTVDVCSAPSRDGECEPEPSLSSSALYDGEESEGNAFMFPRHVIHGDCIAILDPKV